MRSKDKYKNPEPKKINDYKFKPLDIEKLKQLQMSLKRKNNVK